MRLSRARWTEFTQYFSNVPDSVKIDKVVANLYNIVMAVFRPEGLFYDSLSGLYKPRTDPYEREHSIARLAVGTCTKGEPFELSGQMIYYPTWANQSYCMVDQPPDAKPFDTQVAISESYGRWPADLQFTHYTLRCTKFGKTGLIITGRGLDEEVYPLELGEPLHVARHAAQGHAQRFYDNIRPNVELSEQGSVVGPNRLKRR